MIVTSRHPMEVKMGNSFAVGGDHGLCELLHRTCHIMERVRENELRGMGLSVMRAGVLEILKSAQTPVTPSEISRRLYRETHSVSGLLNRMEKEGLIRRVKDLKKKNWVRVEITEKGEDAYRRSLEGNRIQEIMSSLLSSEQATLKAHVTILQNKAIQELRAQLAQGFRLPFP